MFIRKPISSRLAALPAAALAAAALSVSPVSAQSQNTCDVSFLLMDSDDDAMISKSEASAAQQKVFGYLDQNNDGIVSKDEYAECVTGPRYRPAVYYAGRTQAAFNSVDTNNDGKVSRFEYLMSARASYDEVYGAHSKKVPIKAYSSALEHMSTGNPRLDLNGDGFVSPSEAVADVDYTFYELDVNADAHLTIDEWTVTVPAHQVRADTAFNRMDANADGKIDAAEYNAYWAATHKNMNDKPMTVWDYRAQRYYTR